MSTSLTGSEPQKIINDCTEDTDGDSHPLDNIIETDFPCTIASTENIQQLKQSLKSYATAEMHIKAAELSGNDVDIPSINELRYFGYHLCKALSCDNSSEGREKQLDELKKAHKHCKRASYDAIELGLVESLEEIKDFIEHFKGQVIVSDVVPDFAVKKTRVAEIADMMRNHPKPDRDEYYEESLTYLSELRAIASYFDNCTDDLTRKIEETLDSKNKADAAEARSIAAESRAEKAEKRSSKAFKFSIVMGVITALTLGVNIYRASKIPENGTSVQSDSPSHNTVTDTTNNPAIKKLPSDGEE